MGKQRTKLKIKMTNDLLFKLVMQKSPKALKGFVAALLSIPVEGIINIEIMNPIELGEYIDIKDCVLDLKIQINRDEIMNIEMQVVAQQFWEERSMLYLCKAFDTLETGEEYGKLKKTYQIGILNFLPKSMNEQNPEFYSRYGIMNKKTGKLYSDKLNIHMLNLKCIDYATSEDIKSGLRDWAEFFAAATVEQVVEISARNAHIKEAANMMNTVSADRILKEKLAAREKWEHDRATEICEKKRLEEELKKAKENEDETKKENTELKLQLQVFQLHATGTTLADIAEKLDLSKDKVEEILMIK